MKKSRLLVPVLAAAAALALVACSAPTSNASDAEGSTITVAAINNFPPFDYKDNGKLVGFDIDIMEAIAKDQGLTVDWREMKFDGLIPALQAGQIDAAISEIGIREDRLKVVDFSDPYYVDGYALAVRKDSGIKTLSDLNGKTVVATQGSSGVAVVDDLAAKYGSVTRLLTTSDALYMDVESGNADALVIDASALAYKVALAGDSSKLTIIADDLTQDDIGIAFPKGSDALVKKVNKGLAAIKSNGSYDEIYAKYFGKK